MCSHKNCLFAFLGHGGILMPSTSVSQVGVSSTCWMMLEDHLHVYKWEGCAFSQATILDGRWLLGGASRVSSSLWNDILTVDAAKQKLFLDSGWASSNSPRNCAVTNTPEVCCRILFKTNSCNSLNLTISYLSGLPSPISLTFSYQSSTTGSVRTDFITELDNQVEYGQTNCH